MYPSTNHTIQFIFCSYFYSSNVFCVCDLVDPWWIFFCCKNFSHNFKSRFSTIREVFSCSPQSTGVCHSVLSKCNNEGLSYLKCKCYKALQIFLQ